jgi:hypothetical protein
MFVAQVQAAGQFNVLAQRSQAFANGSYCGCFHRREARGDVGVLDLGLFLPRGFEKVDKRRSGTVGWASADDPGPSEGAHVRWQDA